MPTRVGAAARARSLAIDQGRVLRLLLVLSPQFLLLISPMRQLICVTPAAPPLRVAAPHRALSSPQSPSLLPPPPPPLPSRLPSHSALSHRSLSSPSASPCCIHHFGSHCRQLALIADSPLPLSVDTASTRRRSKSRPAGRRRPEPRREWAREAAAVEAGAAGAGCVPVAAPRARHARRAPLLRRLGEARGRWRWGCRRPSALDASGTFQSLPRTCALRNKGTAASSRSDGGRCIAAWWAASCRSLCTHGEHALEPRIVSLLSRALTEH